MTVRVTFNFSEAQCEAIAEHLGTQGAVTSLLLHEFVTGAVDRALERLDQESRYDASRLGAPDV